MAKKNESNEAGATAAEKPQAQDNSSPVPENRSMPKGHVRVRVVGQPVAEGDGRYSKGDEFAVTEQRRAALGTFVEDVK